MIEFESEKSIEEKHETVSDESKSSITMSTATSEIPSLDSLAKFKASGKQQSVATSARTHVVGPPKSRSERIIEEALSGIKAIGDRAAKSASHYGL